MSGNIICCETTEKASLGCIAASQGSVLDLNPFTEDHFFTFATRRVFQEMAAIHRGGAPVTLELVLSGLGADLVKIGGPGALTEIFFYPTASDHTHLFEILETKRILRKSQELGFWISSEVRNVKEAEGFLSELRAKTQALETSREEENELASGCEAMEKRLQEIEAGKRASGLLTPFGCWNRTFGGLVEGRMYGMASRPGMGKTAALEQMACNIAVENLPVLIFERDMSPQALIERVACRAVKVPHWQYSQGRITKDQAQELRVALSALKTLPIHLLSPDGLTPERMCSITRRYQRRHGIKAVFLDHMQVLRVGKDLREGLTQASITIRQTVTDTGIPHVCLLHLNRNGAGNGKTISRPTAEDIKEFDQFYGDCDGLTLLWTEIRKEENEEERLPMKFYFAKNRFGPVGESDVLFNGSLMKFEEPARQ